MFVMTAFAPTPVPVTDMPTARPTTLGTVTVFAVKAVEAEVDDVLELLSRRTVPPGWMLNVFWLKLPLLPKARPWPKRSTAPEPSGVKVLPPTLLVNHWAVD